MAIVPTTALAAEAIGEARDFRPVSSAAMTEPAEAATAPIAALPALPHNEGVWRGKADKAGTKTDVSVDFQGNVNPTK